MLRSIVGLALHVVETLISDKNPLLKEVRRLASGGAPGEDRLVLAEGPHLLDEALRSKIEIHAVILAESAGEIPDWAASTPALSACWTACSTSWRRPNRPRECWLWSGCRSGLRRLVTGHAAGGGSGWRAGSRERGSHPADRGGLRGHRRGVPQGHGQSVQSQMSAGFGGFGVSSAYR